MDEKALADVIAAELDIAEMVLTDPQTLRRLKAERIARAVVASLSPGSPGETEGAAVKAAARATVYMHEGRRYMNVQEIDGRLGHLPPGKHDLFLAPAPPSAMLSAAGERG